jgi:hypothetical protein
MNCLTRKRTIFTELEELVDSEEKELQLTLCCLVTPDSLRRFKNISTLRLKKCHKTWTNSEHLVRDFEVSGGIPISKEFIEQQI